MASESKRPEDSAFKQQKLEDWQPRMNINHQILIYLVIGILFLPIGFYLRSESSEIVEYRIQYDGDGSDVTNCYITSSNEDTSCQVTFTFTDAASGPFYVYYQIENFYQNHRRYVKSRSADQLMGQKLDYDSVSSDCYPLIANGSLTLNPCGLIANTFFNDVYTLTSSSYTLDTDGISWSYDEDVKFSQVDGFVSAEVDSFDMSCAQALGSTDYEGCSTYNDSGTLYYYKYPDTDEFQYLYQTFTSISPIKGVTDEHFINWMRTAGLPDFRKLYGKIDSDFSAGDTLEFDITLNFEVESYGGTKSIVISNLGVIGGKSNALGNCFLIFGSVALGVGLLFALKRIFKPRPLGDIRQLSWSSY